MTEYRVWCENGDLIMVTEYEEGAKAELADLRDNCPGDHDEDDTCGVIHDHGYFIQVVVDD